ncbi:MAG: EF-hand domain-containing protein [Candidatus Sericytochromatia bacterium]
MRFGTPLRAALAAALTASLAAGCAQAPVLTGAMPQAIEDGMEVLAKPVNQQAVALAKTWQRDARQVGVMINRSPKGVQDAATFVFASPRAKTRMLIVIASQGGLVAQELAVNDRTAEGLATASPITQAHGKLVSSKKIFKKAEYAGLKDAEDMVVINAPIEGKTTPVAIVTDGAGDHYIVMNAVTGEPISTVAKVSGRSVQVHVLIIGGVVLAVAVGAAVWWAVKRWRKGGDKPNPHPSPIPTASPLPTPVPSSKPATPVGQVLAGPFGDMFDRLDSDRDGALTITEYLRPAKDATTQRVKTNEWREFIDARHQSKVSKREFLAGIERSVANLCGLSFSMLDSDQNGGLDPAETASAVPASEFRQADTNGDGQLSQVEYMVPFAKKEAMFAPHYK